MNEESYFAFRMLTFLNMFVHISIPSLCYGIWFFLSSKKSCSAFFSCLTRHILYLIPIQQYLKMFKKVNYKFFKNLFAFFSNVSFECIKCNNCHCPHRPPSPAQAPSAPTTASRTRPSRHSWRCSCGPCRPPCSACRRRGGRRRWPAWPA